MTETYRLSFTRAELQDLKCILEEKKEEGSYFGRKDYWDKHLNRIIYETNKVLNLAYVEDGKQ